MATKKTGEVDLSSEFNLVIPSRARPKEAAKTLGAMPKHAVVFVAEEEADDYMGFVDSKKIFTHPNDADRMTVKRNLILDQWGQDKPVMMIDDDFQSVHSLVWKTSRRYVDRGTMTRIIWNGVRVVQDLDLGLYCWSRTGNPMLFRGHDPIKLVMYAAGAFVVAPGRKYRFDEKFVLLADVDFSLQALLHDRSLICDNRWYFNFGKTFGNKGGAQKVRNRAQIQKDEDYIQEKWGKYIKITERSISSAGKKDWRNSAGIKGVHIAVSRRASRGQK